MALKATRQCQADPRERLRGADVTCIFIFTRKYRVIVHISIRYFGFKLTLLIVTPYIPACFPLFFPYGTKFHIVFKLQVTWHNEEHQIRELIN